MLKFLFMVYVVLWLELHESLLWWAANTPLLLLLAGGYLTRINDRSAWRRRLESLHKQYGLGDEK